MRYERQLLIPQIGQEGQEKLEKAKVTVIGAGGLGSPVLTYLVSAGVGKIQIVDCDVVSESNLNRQFLHHTGDVGRPKVLSAQEKLVSLNPDVALSTVNKRLNQENIEECIIGSDVVVDCVDNIETRVMVASACIQLNIPLVEGGVLGFYGYVIDIGRDYPCLSCLGYDKAKQKTPVPVLGVTAGVIGCMQANECIKLLLGIGEPLYGRMLNYDGLSGTWEEVKVEKAKNCAVHKNAETGKNGEFYWNGGK
ncbi:HesA/MoeB/ThiF family protein [Propionispira arboris]|uniref:HesA/MoeB/ThiF family protein n=1 Tax=Propionispira arboris TaxID=84035 RepID=UPI000B31C042|nr:HesA/MoeB/ThiF family protein [Propionispira arboris]